MPPWKVIHNTKEAGHLSKDRTLIKTDKASMYFSLVYYNGLFIFKNKGWCEGNVDK